MRIQIPDVKRWLVIGMMEQQLEDLLRGDIRHGKAKKGVYRDRREITHRNDV